MILAHWAVTSTIRGVTRVLCRVEDDWISQVPQQGPLILVCNHINFLDIPVVYSHLQPRPVTGFAKIETWDNPFMGLLFNLWGAIPIQRGEADRHALLGGLKALEEGKILAITPEGTRSGDGHLRRGRPGVALISIMSGAPILPLAYFGSEDFHQKIRKLQRTDFHVRVGRRFRIAAQPGRIRSAERRQITEEIMYQLARLLPEDYRGDYANLELATEKYLVFE